ncbi:LOW QUALITY PROTEIN: hypothetical protein Cgig2_017113 [Carnegiea gigantea]|uniref:Uncharacterized protein n=1 Tax=Carnegiea gigantea TaxID=171969 RepID=A0A9Q1K304_9CARY|nr:LOW QUALITY PROTEIN: hypothetical protein Cgig2_017113 [Carnegiea gigantea]
MNDLQNPLFLHPFKGLGSLFIQEKLQGANNDRSWRRNVEIGLVAKRKLRITRSDEDLIKVDMWDTCNSMVIAHEIWLQLEQRFSISNGSRKYIIHKEIYEAKSYSYARLRCYWEELKAMNELPKLTVTEEIKVFLQVLTKQREEQRSQLLLMTPLPSVEAACSLIQQEESEREILEVTNWKLRLLLYIAKMRRLRMQELAQHVGTRGIHLTTVGLS